MKSLDKIRIRSIPIFPSREKLQILTGLNVDEVITRISAFTQKPRWFNLGGLPLGTRFYGKFRDDTFSAWVCSPDDWFGSAAWIRGTITATETGARIDFTFSCTASSFVFEVAYVILAAILGASGYPREAGIALLVIAGMHLFVCYNYQRTRSRTEIFLLKLLEAQSTGID